MGWVINFHPKGINFFVGMDHLIGKTGAKMIPLSSNFSFNLGLNVAWGGKKSKKGMKTLTFWKMPDTEAQKTNSEKKQSSATDNTEKGQQAKPSVPKN